MTKTIVLAVSGSISAYKAADLSNQLTKLGYQVHVLMTDAATQFITPLTLQVLSKNPVHLDVMKEDNPKVVHHIELAKQADLFVVAPASANTIAKLAHGIADNIVTATALALPTDTPKLIAPAMNTKMYDNPLTQRNLQILQEVGYQKIEPRSSRLACGDVGRGALAELDVIVQTIQDTIEN
ncbi:phosphopantothenoylcysteine decarboxylase [Streptococcus gallolyticus]|uniref:Phosphopantothenoylcysteine decarboxylase n=1 Tax=Streptococcus gallolyticus TaxID=315405 RepID=A0A368UG23_9STRE|nr:phosphopantothenoylcysteine decarboxylase [Streptococcus gallolyticus]RCW17944.1 phosphopantothenoylcysteine decarboxylase [Streptococcus gallolyticus]